MSAILDVDVRSRQRVYWKVRLWDEEDVVSEWSEKAFFEMGLLKQSDFVAKWINPELECDPQVHKPASYLSTTFVLENQKCESATLENRREARLYITAHGLYEVFINGKRVGNFVLAPGTFDYGKRIAYQTYDVSELLREGENGVQVILGDGWYRSCSGVDGDRNLYGEDVALYFQLEIDGKPVCLSDESWLASQNGPIRENDMQQGEFVDARLELGYGMPIESELVAEVVNRLTQAHAVKVENFLASVDPEKCIGCGKCHEVCPVGCIDLITPKG